MPYRNASRATAGLSELAQLQAVPITHRPLRLPTYPQIERTSILSLSGTSGVTINTSTSSLGVVVRQPAAPVWYTNTTSITGVRLFRYTLPAGAPALPQTVGSELYLVPLYDSIVPSVSTTIVGSTPNFQGIALDPTESPWVWVPAAMQMYFMIETSATLAGGSWQLTYDYIQGFAFDVPSHGQLLLTTGSSFALGVQTFGGGWWRASSICCLQAPSTPGMTITGICMGYQSGGTTTTPIASTAPFLDALTYPPPEFTKAPFLYEDSRINALGVLFQNATSVMYKEGTVEAFLTNSDVAVLSNNWAFGSAYSDIAPRSRYYGLLERGIYTFSLPDAPSSLFQDCTYTTTTGLIPAVRLGGSANLNIIRFNDLAGSGSNLGVEFCFHLEFRNTTMLWPVGFSAVQLEHWHQAQVALQKMGCFFENPTHLAAIATLARQAAIRAWPVIRPIASAALTAARAQALPLAKQAAAAIIKKLKTPPTRTVTRAVPQKPRPKSSRKRQMRR